MKKIRLKGLLVGAIMIVMMFACTVIGYAASGSVTFGSNSYSVNEGKEFNIGVYVKSDVNVGAYTFSITYDSDKIEYISGADAASEGILSFAGYPNNKNTKIWLTFKAKASGTCTIAVTNPYIGPSDASHGDSLTISKASSAPITIKGGSSSGGTTTGNTSGSADLKSIWIEETGFYGFKADKTEYDITVNNDMEKVTVTAKAADANATVTISDTNLKVGANYIYITVKATDGTTKKYTVIVRRKQGESTTTTAPSETTTAATTPAETTTPEGPVTPPVVDETRSLFSYNNVPLYFCKGFDGVAIPDGYTETGITINNDYQADALVNGNGSKILLHLTESADKSGRLYIYSITDGSIYPYIELVSNDKIYIFDGSMTHAELPAGYEKVAAEINGIGDVPTVINAWYNSEAEGFYLIYASCDGKASELYQYDEKEGTIQRFNNIVTAGNRDDGNTSAGNDSEEVVKLKAEIAGLKEQNKAEMKIWLVIVIILAVVCVILLVGIFFIFNRMREQQEYAGYEEEDMEYYDDEDSYADDGLNNKQSEYFGNTDNQNDNVLVSDEEEDEDIDENDFTFL